MRITVQLGSGAIELRALSRRRMDRLAGLAIGIVEAAGDDARKPDHEFGFIGGSSLETENVGQQQEELWQDTAVISARPSRRRLAGRAR